MTDSRPYSRLYWQVLREYPDMVDCELLGAFAHLLIGADMAWDGTESRPFLPRHVKDTTLAKLVTMGLIDVTGATYSVKGHTKERARRSEHASKASTARWNARSNARSNAGAYQTPNARASGVRMPSKAEHSKAEHYARE